MKIKRINEFNSESKIITEQFPEYLLIVGKKSEDMFTFFGVDEMHGLSLEECRLTNETPTNAYISGLCNQFPEDSSKYFIFINSDRIKGMFDSDASYEAPLLIMHECMHMSLEVNGTNLSDGELEEKAITWAEEESIKIIRFLKSNNIL